MFRSVSLIVMVFASSVASAVGLTPDQLCARLSLEEEVIVLSNDGKHVIDVSKKSRRSLSGGQSDSPQDEVCGMGGSSGQRSSLFDGPLFFTWNLSVKKDGTIQVTHEQGESFTGRGRDARLVNSAGKVTVDVKDMEAVRWVSPFHKNQRVIVQLTPQLSDPSVRREIGKFPLVLKDALIFDGAGNLWSSNISGSSNFFGVTTVKGTLLLSFQPFAEGKKIGQVTGRDLRFKTPDGTSVLVKNGTDFLPGDITSDVYVMYDPKLKAKSFSAQSTSSGSDVAEVLKNLRSPGTAN